MGISFESAVSKMGLNCRKKKKMLAHIHKKSGLKVFITNRLVIMKRKYPCPATGDCFNDSVFILSGVI